MSCIHYAVGTTRRSFPTEIRNVFLVGAERLSFVILRCPHKFANNRRERPAANGYAVSLSWGRLPSNDIAHIIRILMYGLNT